MMVHLITLLVVLLGVMASPEPVAYQGKIRLPAALYTLDGVRIAKGVTEVEVRRERQHHLLFFLSDGKIVAAINGRRLEEGAELEATVPILGTTYLRSTSEPLGSEEDRRFSKTGRPLYEEETWDWKTTLRAYRPPARQSTDVLFVFHERGAGSVTFPLVLK